MNIAQIEQTTASLFKSVDTGDISPQDFIFELLLAYGHRKQSVTRLKSGERNLASKSNTPKHDEVIWKRHLHFKVVESSSLHTEIDRIRKEKSTQTFKVRFIIVTDYKEILAVDTKTTDTLDIAFSELPKQFDFFLPWAGMEKAVYQGDNPADVKAAEKMAKLFDLIKSDNFDDSNKDDKDALHNLNVFLTRLLFCFFAEDTEIFRDNQFSNAIKSHTVEDGSDLSEYLDRLFKVLNTADSSRGELPDYLSDFPYVNGGLFANSISAPKFSRKSRRMLIECGSELDWSDINPDIFGSMIQAVVHSDQRGSMGMHYTSVTNIMKAIEPLFLNDLYEELEKAENSPTKLQRLQQRLGEIKIFDPACGSGNFLIIAYKELRKLEMEILKVLQDIERSKSGQHSQAFSTIRLSQFYGIELDDFAHEVAILSLWLTEHQMNTEFKYEFGDSAPSLPLVNNGGIICGNATQIDWSALFDADNEIYIIGNPPYIWSNDQSKSQKYEMGIIFKDVKSYKYLDYVSCWLMKAAQFIQKNKKSRSALVATNSICQGQQVQILWPEIYKNDIEINFAYQAFKWKNNAKDNAGVTCVIIGFSPPSKNKRLLYSEGISREVGNINAYLLPTGNMIIGKTRASISGLQKMSYGNKAVDGGHLFLTENEREALIREYPHADRLIRRVMGATEFLYGNIRYCLWIDDSDYEFAMTIPAIKKRVDKVKQARLLSRDKGANKLASRPHQFRDYKNSKNHTIVIPSASSENRPYLPIGLVSKDIVLTNRAHVIYDGDMFTFGLLSSRMHLIWVLATAGRLESRINYSSEICYNNFPIPKISHNLREQISEKAMDILTAREKYSNRNIAELYDRSDFPDELRKPHEEIDLLLEKQFGLAGSQSDEAKLECMFNLYENMT